MLIGTMTQRLFTAIATRCGARLWSICSTGVQTASRACQQHYPVCYRWRSETFH